MGVCNTRTGHSLDVYVCGTGHRTSCWSGRPPWQLDVYLGSVWGWNMAVRCLLGECSVH